nr:MAG TPA: hypothetical protein [Caudoviricetes sp.]
MISKVCRMKLLVCGLACAIHCRIKLLVYKAR